jgi:hypothetical protein
MIDFSSFSAWHLVLIALIAVIYLVIAFGRRRL